MFFQKKWGKGERYPFTEKKARMISLVMSVVMLTVASVTVDLPGYIYYVSQQSTIYQDEYVDPMKAEITFPEEKRNLIL